MRLKYRIQIYICKDYQCLQAPRVHTISNQLLEGLNPTIPALPEFPPERISQKLRFTIDNWIYTFFAVYEGTNGV